MATDMQMLYPCLLLELFDSDDEKPCRGKTREWVKRRSELGAFATIVNELIVEDRFGFKSMFRMSLEDFKNILGHIQDLITPQEIIGGAHPIYFLLLCCSFSFRDAGCTHTQKMRFAYVSKYSKFKRFYIPNDYFLIMLDEKMAKRFQHEKCVG